MGSLVQQINLYRRQDDAVTASAGARVLLFAGVGAVFVVLMLALAGEFYLSGTIADRALVAENLRKRESALAEYVATASSPQIDPYLEAELARLQETRDNLSLNLAAIVRQTGTRSAGFSDYFSGLARNTVDGLWFKNVALAAGGEEMLLKGQATEPELVPRLLQTLATEQAFAGRTFRKVSFERQGLESGAVIDFELRSARIKEADDAG